MPKIYQVYAIGNAIVDFVFKLSREKDWPGDIIAKDTTLLVDGIVENKLLKKLENLRPTKLCGGTGANTLSVIKQMGGQVFYSCSVAEDEDGNFYHQNLRASGIKSNLDFHPKKIDIATAKCMLLIAADANRSLCTSPGASGQLAMTDLDENIMANAEYVFVELFLATSPQSKKTAVQAIQMAKKLGCKTALTISTCTIPDFNKNHLTDMVGTGVDLLFCNEAEARFFCNTDEWSEIKAKLKTLAKQFIITRGAQATLVYDGHEFFEVATYPVRAVDTTGAGDVFAGAFLYAITAGASFKKAANIANFAAAKVVAKVGARLGQNDINDVKEHQHLL